VALLFKQKDAANSNVGELRGEGGSGVRGLRKSTKHKSKGGREGVEKRPFGKRNHREDVNQKDPSRRERAEQQGGSQRSNKEKGKLTWMATDEMWGMKSQRAV